MNYLNLYVNPNTDSFIDCLSYAYWPKLNEIDLSMNKMNLGKSDQMTQLGNLNLAKLAI